jgi:hypothetical protein
MDMFPFQADAKDILDVLKDEVKLH